MTTGMARVKVYWYVATVLPAVPRIKTFDGRILCLSKISRCKDSKFPLTFVQERGAMICSAVCRKNAIEVVAINQPKGPRPASFHRTLVVVVVVVVVVDVVGIGLS
jgi:hypothetical protein